MRRILFCTIGTNPQIVTETIWVLRGRTPAWVPAEIHVVTTAFRLEAVRGALQDGGGPLARMFDGAPPAAFVHVPTMTGGAATFGPDRARDVPPGLMDDVDGEGDATMMGDVIYRLMLGFTDDPDSEVHMSLAGGRKTMSAHALLAMTLLGRSRDRASHVLVSSAFEHHPDFWHPDQGGLIHRRAELRLESRPAPTLDPRDATISLVPTPTPLFRHSVRDLPALRDISLAKAIGQQNLAVLLDKEPSLILDTATNAVVVHGETRTFTPRNFALYRLMAQARREGWDGVGPGGYGAGHAGWLSAPQICAGRAAGRRIDAILLDHIRAACLASPTGREPENDPTFAAWKKIVAMAPSWDKLDQAKTFLGSNTRLKGEIGAEFGEPAFEFLGPAEIEVRGGTTDGRRAIIPHSGTRFGLRLPPGAIEIR